MTIKQPDQNYIPPVSDPIASGAADWDRLRTEYMLMKERSTELEAELVTANTIIDRQNTELAQVHLSREQDRNEAASLRTSLVNAADIIHNAARRAGIARNEASDYAKPLIPSAVQGEPVAEEDQREIERILSAKNQA